ncbi:MAG: DNA gyrase modulator, partial [Candidatus Caldarchaeum sp.]
MSGSMDVEDLLEFVLKRGGELGASYVEARFQRDHQSQIVLKNGVPEVSADVVERGVSVRLLYRGSLGFAYVNQLDRASLRKAVAAAFDMAKAASTRSQDVKMSEEKLVKASDIKRPRIRYDDVDNRDKIELLKEADAAGVEAADKLGVKLVSRFIELGKWSTEKHVVNSDGGDV